MKFKKIDGQIGDTLKISDVMSLRFEKITEDLGPVWHEIPSTHENRKYDEGSFVEVTPDCWFVLDQGRWRMMSTNEHIVAARESWLSSQ